MSNLQAYHVNLSKSTPKRKIAVHFLGLTVVATFQQPNIL